MPDYHVAGFELEQLTATIKRARSALMCHGSQGEVVVLHRKIAVQHVVSERCDCYPILITQNDHRPSLYFAEQILYPVVH